MRPRRGRLVERLLIYQRGAVRRLGVLVPRAGGRGTQFAGRVLAEDAGAVLPDEGAELLEPGAVRDYVRVSPRTSNWLWEGQWSSMEYDVPVMPFLSQNSSS